ncbi:hypothetical protein B0T22DRAFT_523563 [Podospora appendiculata]|uniref:2EXR domain-containing protein n=1 Tax=Podospora appendiculata TaxID=314037 RepID=A0AAE1C7F1_9PEZI|nr:hypothetical protein B0T22DRAFT_523563 [Podospora appendiculata]
MAERLSRAWPPPPSDKNPVPIIVSSAFGLPFRNWLDQLTATTPMTIPQVLPMGFKLRRVGPTFPKFMSLPAKIRSQIWEHAIWTDIMNRTISLAFYVDVSPDPARRPAPVVMFANTEWLIDRRGHLRPLLLACRESNGEVRRRFPDALPIRCVVRPGGRRHPNPAHAILPFNRAHDLLAFPIVLESRRFQTQSLPKDTAVYYHRLRSNNIVFLGEPFLPIVPRGPDLREAANRDPESESESLMTRLEAELRASGPTAVVPKANSVFNTGDWLCVVETDVVTTPGEGPREVGAVTK